MKFKVVLLLVGFLSLNACKQQEISKPKNVIFLIADGTSLSQISTAFYFKETTPNYARFNQIGLMNTSSASHLITDSAAGATAFACGVRTYNGAIGVSVDTTSVENLVEIASRNNIKSGLVATSSITHATPASFYAHVKHRGMGDEIATELINSDVDYFAAGGLKYFNKRKDGKNLLNELKVNKFSVDTTSLQDFSSIQNEEKVAYLLKNDAMPKMTENRGDFLENATQLGIDFLGNNNQQFFMVVEGSQVDWGGHDNNGEYVVTEIIDFDEAIGKALDFAEKDGNTLVIVTGDHETGGLALSPKRKTNEEGEEYNDYNDIELTFTTGGHTTTLLPVFAYGPGSEEFTGVYKNIDIFSKILKVTGWK